MKKLLCSLLLPALFGGAVFVSPAAQALPAGDAATVSLDVTNVPMPAALRTLFKAADIRNFVIDADVQGRVNARLKDIPFSLALKQVLSSANPPLAAEVQDGVYRVRLKSRPSNLSPAPSGDARAAAPLANTEQSQVYKTGINHYDARVMADLITRQSGIILVPSNLVMLGNAAAPSLSAGPNVTTVGGGPFGQGPPAAVPVTAAPNMPVPGSQTVPVNNNTLSDGIKRIFALQSDNSLVIETGSTSQPVGAGNPFFSPGYNPFF